MVETAYFSGTKSGRIRVDITDAGLSFSLVLSEKVSVDFADVPADASVSGGFADMVSLLLGRSDGDALFFSGKIGIEGDAALVVALRNRMESVDWSAVRRALGPVGEVLWS